MEKVRTKGNVIVNELQVGDKIYEYCYLRELITFVKTLPTRDVTGLWSWIGVDEKGTELKYSVHENYPHYSPNIYTYPAYRISAKMSDEECGLFKK